MLSLKESESDVDAPRIEERANEIRATIIKKYSNRTEEDERNEDGSEMSEKEFDNFLVTANSPRGRSPPFNSKKLELMEWEMAAPRVRLQHNVLRVFHMINAVFCVKFHTSFFLRMMLNGGWYFLIPFTLCLVFISTPLAFLELALGQFTSQQSVTIFERMSPILNGVGLLFAIFRVIILVHFRTEHRFVSLIWNKVRKVFFSDRNTMCFLPERTDCFIPDRCEKNEVFYQGACYDRRLLFNRGIITMETSIRLGAAELLQKLDKVEQNVIPHVDRVFNLETNSHRIDAVITFMILVVVSSKLGARWMTKASMVVLISSGIAFISSFFLLLIFKSPFPEGFKEFIKFMTLSSDPSSLIKHSVWQDALFSSFMVLGVGDGTLHSLGAVSPFTNNIFFDVLILLVAGASFSFLLIFLFGMISVVGLHVEINEFSQLQQLNSSDVLAKLLTQPFINSYMNNYYYFSWIGFKTQVIAAAFFVCCILLQITNHVLMAENILRSLVRMWHDLSLVGEHTLRHCVFVVYAILFGVLYSFVHFHLPKLHEHIGSLFALLISVTVFYECCGIRVFYNTDRFMTNILTMFNGNPNAYKWAKNLSRSVFIIWSTVVPIVTAGLFSGEILVVMRENGLTPYTLFLVLLTAFPLLIAVRKVVLTWSMDEKVEDLFRPMPTWGPFTVRDKRNADYDEKAARIAGWSL